jgi:hypothetical protein
MPALSVENNRLPSNDRVTVTKLFKLGYNRQDTLYTMDAAALGAAGLSTNGLVALVRATVPRMVAEDGTELRAQSMLVSAVTVHANGSADFTLTIDLEA